jgi:DNA helicase II / ATP-dependent DNA helicase PcrA
VLAFYQNTFRYIHVDEYQDTNHAQYRLIRLLAKQHQNLCVVGDDDQSIYGWRNADITNILNFEKDYSSIRIFKLEQNYRSTKNILTVASQVVKNNNYRTDKTLWTDKDKGDPVTVIECDTDRQEARAAVDAIKDLIHKEKRKFADFAILYRTNAQSRIIEDVLRKEVIPYVIVGGLRFYERKEVKDILAYLKFINNPSDHVSLIRIINFPPRGIGKTTIEKIDLFAEKNNIPPHAAILKITDSGDHDISPRTIQILRDFIIMIDKYRELKDQMLFTEWVRILLDETGIIKLYKQENTIEAINRYENIMEFLNAIHDYTQRFDSETAQEDILSAFLKEVSLVTDIDEWNDEKNTVTLMTIHSSKGLEFPVVSMVGLEEGLFPLENATQDIKELEEERRLFYVGATRAKQKLFLYFARRRMRYNNVYNCVQSRFIDEIPVDLIQWEESISQEQKSFFEKSKNHYNTIKTYPPYTTTNIRKKIKEKQSVYVVPEKKTIKTEYRIGQRVEHSVFGIGKIIKSEGNGEKLKLTVHFQNGEERKLIVKFANLIIR